MKQAAYGIVVGVIIILTIGIILTINGKKTRRDDMENALSLSVKNAVETTMNQKTYYIENNQEFIADFTQNLLVQISNDADIEVKVSKADYENGLLSVRVEEKFLHPNGNEGKNICETTVVFEKVPTKAELVTITYMLDTDILYKEYQLAKGDTIIVPKPPQKDGKTFRGWMEKADEGVVKEFGKAEGNKIYLAVFQ